MSGGGDPDGGRTGRRTDRTAARHDRTGGTAAGGLAGVGKKGRVSTETLPPICFMKEPVGNPAPGTPLLSPPSSPDPAPPPRFVPFFCVS